MMSELDDDRIRQVVRERYAGVAQGSETGCCGPSTCCDMPNIDAQSMSQAMGCSAAEVLSVPEGANLGLGRGNPQAIAALKPGKTVLDLGSGTGFDAFLAAQKVGNTGRVIGVG